VSEREVSIDPSYIFSALSPLLLLHIALTNRSNSPHTSTPVAINARSLPSKVVMASTQQQHVVPCADPSIPLPDGCCLLLALPHELRDMVYKYALTDDYGLTAHRISGGNFEFHGTPSTLGQPSLELNQLQYTNQQLREETKGMVFGLNNLYLAGRRQDYGTQFAVECLQRCSSTNRAALHKITIYFACYGPSTGETANCGIHAVVSTLHPYSPLSRFCQNNPQVSVIVRFPHLYHDCSTWEWIGWHHGLRERVRGGPSWEHLSDTYRSWWQFNFAFANQYSFYSLIGHRLPNNLRCTLTQDFEITRAMMEGQRGSRGTEKLDEVLADAKRMFEEGI
jgi:hypothetical protein